MTPIKKVVFDTSRWITGRLAAPRYEGLDRGATETFCALGFYMNQVGFSSQELHNGGSPYGLNAAFTPEEREVWAQRLIEANANWLVCPKRDPNGNITHFANSRDADEIVEINDSIDDEFFQDDEEREHFDDKRRQSLKDIFAKHGIEVEFISGAPK